MNQTFPKFSPHSAHDKRRYRSYLRFITWALAHGETFDTISGTTIEGYRTYLSTKYKRSTAGASLSDLRRFWQDKAIQGLLPAFEWPNFSRWYYGVTYEKWPQSVKNEYNVFLESAKFGGRWKKPLAEKSIYFYRRAISLVLGYLVKSGADIRSLSLSDLFKDAHIPADFIEWHRKRYTFRQDRIIQRDVLRRLRLISSKIFNDSVSANRILILEDRIPAHSKAPTGLKNFVPLSVRNKVWKELITKLIQLPTGLSGSTPEEKIITVAAVQDMIILALLLQVPLRPMNVVGASLNNILPGFNGLRFEDHEMKHYRSFESDLPPHLGIVLEKFVTSWRPLLNKQDRNELFLSSDGQPLTRTALTNNIKALTLKLLGVSCTPHGIRSLVASAIYSDNPESLEGISKLLGHSSVDVTTKAYAFMNGIVASKKVAEHLHNTCSSYRSLRNIAQQL